jgi:hypothetical protein
VFLFFRMFAVISHTPGSICSTFSLQGEVTVTETQELTDLTHSLTLPSCTNLDCLCLSDCKLRTTDFVYFKKGWSPNTTKNEIKSAVYGSPQACAGTALRFFQWQV